MDLGLSNWIIIVSALLMVGVVLHGISLRWRSRRNRLRIDIDRTLPRDDVNDLDLLRAELPNGGARPMQPETARGSRQSPPVLLDPAATRGTRVTPRIDSEEASPALKESAPVLPVQDSESEAFTSNVEASEDETGEAPIHAVAAPAVQPVRAADLFGDDDSFPPTTKRPNRGSSKQRREGGARPRDIKISSGAQALADPPAALAQSRPSALIVINVFCRDADGFSGDQLVQLVHRKGLKYGDMNIFHRLHTSPKRGVDYSMASAVEPGTFDLSTIKETRIRGVSFFLQLPGPSQPVEAFDHMHDVAQTISQTMNGELKDEALSVMTPQTIEHCRERIREFTRKYALRN